MIVCPLATISLDVVVKIEDPVQRLLRRGDVVAPGAEADDRRLDVAQIDAHALGRADLAGCELVADEQVVGDPLHLAGVQQHRAAPPGLEFEEALGLRIDLGIDVVGLGPKGVGGIERLEIGDEAGAVENPCAHVAGERGQPRAAERAAEVAHRILAANAGPIGERRAGQHDHPGQLGTDRRRHHDLPACLAIGDDDRLALGLGVPLRDLLQEDRLGAADVFDRLPRNRLRQEADEIDRVAGAQRHADFALGLHAADPGSVAGARVDDDDRRLRRIDCHIRGRNDAHQRVIDRPLQACGRRAPLRPAKLSTCGASLAACASWMLPRSLSVSRSSTLRCHASVQYCCSCVEIGRLVDHCHLPSTRPPATTPTRPQFELIKRSGLELTQ